jgi:hypothetical protein
LRACTGACALALRVCVCLYCTATNTLGPGLQHAVSACRVPRGERDTYVHISAYIYTYALADMDMYVSLRTCAYVLSCRERDRRPCLPGLFILRTAPRSTSRARARVRVPSPSVPMYTDKRQTRWARDHEPRVCQSLSLPLRHCRFHCHGPSYAVACKQCPCLPKMINR